MKSCLFKMEGFIKSTRGICQEHSKYLPGTLGVFAKSTWSICQEYLSRVFIINLALKHPENVRSISRPFGCIRSTRVNLLLSWICVCRSPLVTVLVTIRIGILLTSLIIQH